MLWTLVPISKVRIILPSSTFALLTIHVLPKNTIGEKKKKKKFLGSQGSLDIKKYPHTTISDWQRERKKNEISSFSWEGTQTGTDNLILKNLQIKSSVLLYIQFIIKWLQISLNFGGMFNINPGIRVHS